MLLWAIFFDSLGRTPNDALKRYMNVVCKHWTFTSRQLQSVVSALCGHYVKLRVIRFCNTMWTNTKLQNFTRFYIKPTTKIYNETKLSTCYTSDAQSSSASLRYLASRARVYRTSQFVTFLASRELAPVRRFIVSKRTNDCHLGI